MNKKEYIELPREKITFYGETKAERKANELIFDLILENDELYQENKDLQQRIDKAKDKLYCWGEVLDPNFQKEMLEILGDKNE